MIKTKEIIIIKRYIHGMCVTFHCVYAFAFMSLLFSCDHDVIPPNVENPEIPTGELIMVDFSVNDAGYDEGGVVTRSAASLDDPPITLRGNIISLDQNVTLRIVAYGGISYTDYYGYADFQVMFGNIITPISNPLSVPTGNCRFVAYSFNETTAMPPFAPTTSSIGSQDVLWGYADETINSTTHTVHITMHHLMAKVVVRASTGLTSTDFMNSANINVLCYEPTLTVKTGTLNPNGSLVAKPFSWHITNQRLPMQTSDTLYVFTDEADSTRLRIDQMVINYNKFTGPFDVTYHEPLETGKSYELFVQFNWTRGGTADRITWDGSKYAITRDPTDAGLYFKFGSVVGLFSDAGSILTLPGQINIADSVFNASRDIAWHPFPSITSWGAVPTYDISDLPKLVTPEDGYHTIANVKAGKGDPCRLVGLDLAKIKNAPSLTYTDIDNGIWRLPSLQENVWFTNNAPYVSDLHFWDAYGTILPQTPPYPSPFGPGVGGAEYPERVNSTIITEGRKAKFLPAAGSRHDLNGNAVRVFQGTFGFYWSNEPVYRDSYLRGNLFFFFFGGTALYTTPPPLPVNPISDDPNWGYSVRCVRQYMHFDITVDDWVNGGSLGTGNVVL